MHRFLLLPSITAAVALVISFADPITAQDATPTVSSSADSPTREVILDVDDVGLPDGHAIVAVDRWSLEPGPDPLVIPPLGGGQIVVVESGSVALETAGEERILKARDILLIPANTKAVYRVSGGEPVIMFVVSMVSGFADAEGWSSDPVRHTVDYLVSSSSDEFSGGTGRVVLERVAMPPAASLPPMASDPLVWIEVGEGALGVTLEGDQLPFRWKSGTERTFRPSQYLPAMQPGTMLTLRNVEDAPLVLYQLSIAPAMSKSDGTPAPGESP